MTSPLRERLVTWTDPMAIRTIARTMSGLDAMRAFQEGKIDTPPIGKLIGFHFVLIESGKVQVAFVPNESHYNPLGSVHGGVIATILDTAVGCAVQTIMPLGRGYTTLNLSVSYIRAITLDTGEVTAEGTVVHSGRTTAVAHGRLTDSRGKLLATAETTCLVFDLPSIDK